MPDFIRERVPLAPLTTLGLGGPAQYLAECRTTEEITEAVRWAAAQRLPVTILGGGSNVVLPDEGLRGLVLRVMTTRLAFRESSGEVEAEAGVSWDALVQGAVARNWAGVECLSGIPGTVGGAPIQNVGAYGQEIASTLRSVTCLDRATISVHTFEQGDCAFAYRTSRFKERDRGRYVVLAVSYRLTPGGAPQITYADVVKAVTPSATLGEVRDAVLAIRRSKGMLIESADAHRSAGSFFTNPTIDEAALQTLDARCRESGLPPVPRYPAGPGRVKLSAAWLVERAGFTRGFRKGGVGVSPHHSLALVNLGGTTLELLSLARDIMDAVEARFGVRLTPEPEIIGASVPPGRTTPGP
jgi:UDP-N-acetylmuramate dehydrogenase